MTDQKVKGVWTVEKGLCVCVRMCVQEHAYVMSGQTTHIVTIGTAILIFLRDK